MSENPQQPETQEESTFSEEIEMRGGELVDRVKELIEEGNVRRLIIRNAQGEELLVVPLTASVVAGGALMVFAPHLAAIGALAAFLTKVKLEVVRVDEDKMKNDTKEKIDLE